MKQVNSDPVRQAMLDLGIPAARLEKNIRSIAPTREEYTAFATIAGRVAKQRLDHIVRDAATTLMGKRLGEPTPIR